MDVDSESTPTVKVVPTPDKSSPEPVWGKFIINGPAAVVSISKELYDGADTIIFKEDSASNSEVHGDWTPELLVAYRQLVELRRAMNYYFFVDGIMKDDVSEISEVMKMDEFDFTQLFNLCEALGDKSMTYYSTYFIYVILVSGAGKKHHFPLSYIRHGNGKIYSDLIGAMLDTDDVDIKKLVEEEIPMVNAHKFDLEFYFEFCKLRTRLNGKLFATNNHLMDVVKHFFDKYTYEVIGQGTVFADYVGDFRGNNTDISVQECQPFAEACGCYISALVDPDTDFNTVNAVITRVDKPATHFLRSEYEATASTAAVKA